MIILTVHLSLTLNVASIYLEQCCLFFIINFTFHSHRVFAKVPLLFDYQISNIIVLYIVGVYTH